MPIINIADAQSKRVTIVFPDKSQVQLKVDGLFFAEGICAVGGWCSEKASFTLVADGIHLDSSIVWETFIRIDDSLHSPKERHFGFAGFGNCPMPQELFLIAQFPLHQMFVVCITLDITNVETEIKPTFETIFGKKVAQNIQTKLNALLQALPAMTGAIENVFSWRGEEGALTILNGWAMLIPHFNLEVQTTDGQHLPLEHIYFYPRPDIDNVFGNVIVNRGYGFCASLDRFFENEKFLTLVAYDERGIRKELCKKQAIQCKFFKEFVEKVVSIEFPWSELVALYNGVFATSLLHLQQNRMRNMESMPFEEGHFGKPPEKTNSSVIIPLYGSNLDMIETQLLCFSEDPSFKTNTEIIYVIDDVSIWDRFNIKMEDFFQIFGVPVRWVFGFGNRGYAAANNLGARVAHGECLIFLNSDAFPNSLGWTEQFHDYLCKHEDAGLVGCRLIYPDGSLQHAGMKFFYRNDLKIWTNIHPHTGLNPVLDPVPNPTPVCAVTGACLAIRHADLTAIGGWTTDYIIGDFEDSDLCLKVRKMGKKVVYLPDICLVHLERQSYPLFMKNNAHRQRLTIFNAITQQNKWGEELAADEAYYD